VYGSVPLGALAAARADGALVLDVREPHEYEAGHVPGARLVPEGAVASRIVDLPRREPVYVICESGNRSARVVDLLSRHGLRAHSVAGGTSAWRAAGHPVVVGPRG
jgi:rhodanese-related sulfurtransferase